MPVGLSKRRFFYFICVIAVSVIPWQGHAQDALFTQFHMSPTHINPAFTGNTYAPLLHINSRLQWPTIGLAYQTTALSYDQHFSKYRSGLGLLLFNDRAGNGIYNTFRLEGMYAYTLRAGQAHFIKVGIGLAVVQHRLNWDKLIFLDQIDPEYGYLDAFGQELISGELRPDALSVIYPDLSVGLLYYSEKFYVGISLKHATNPDQSFRANASGDAIGLPGRYAFQAGGQIPLNNQAGYLNPSLLFSQQANLQQLNIGLIADIGMIYAGLGYRYAFENPDAVLLHAGIDLGLYTIGYSFDFTVSALSVRSGGSHELGIRLNFDHSEWFEKPFRYSDCFEVFR